MLFLSAKSEKNSTAILACDKTERIIRILYGVVMLAHVPKSEARAAILSFIVGITLLGIKFTAYYFTGSATVFSDAIESIVNVVSAAFGLYAISVAHTPPDTDHPYGHGKIEFFSAAFEGGMIILAAMFIIAKAIDTLIHPELAEHLDIGLILMVFSMFCNGALGLYLIWLGKRRGSLTIEADGHHLITDAVTSIVASLTLVVVWFSGWQIIDPIAAILVALYISWSGGKLLKRSFFGLMDRQDSADNKVISEILDRHVRVDGEDPHICSYHKLRHRHSGRYHWVDFHMVVPGTWTIQHAHNAASVIEREIELALGEGDATAHIEPCNRDCDHCQHQEKSAQE